MSISTWHNVITGLHAATYNSYAAKSTRQRKKDEVQNVMADVDGFCGRKGNELASGSYHVGRYQHFHLHDKKKARDISVLPYEDRCVQNDLKDAIQPIVLRQMTDDMMGGLPGCGVLSKDLRHQVVQQMRESLNDRSLTHCLQGDISKFYDNVDNVISIRLIERQVKDRRTRAVIRQHLFNQKKLAIGDPFSHLIANLNMSVIIRKAKAKYGAGVRIINFADDFIAFGKNGDVLKDLRKDMVKWARQQRFHYKPMYVRPVDKKAGKKPQPIVFCGYRFGRGFVHLSQRTKKRYASRRHSRRSMGSYQGIIEVADTKELKGRVQHKDNRVMSEKIRTRFAGKPKKVEALEGIRHTVVDKEEKPSRETHTKTYWHVQAIADGLGLIVYTTSSKKMVEVLQASSLPMRDMVITHDWRGYYYEGTVYTDAEEEEMLRSQYGIPK